VTPLPLCLCENQTVWWNCRNSTINVPPLIPYNLASLSEIILVLTLKTAIPRWLHTSKSHFH